jgi:hypothetical protein
MALTLPDASKLALADKLNGGKSRWQPRFLVYEDSAGTPVLTPLTDTVCVLDSVNFEIEMAGTCVAPAGVTTPFKKLYVVGDVGTYELMSPAVLIELCAAGIADLTPYIIAYDTLSVAVTAGDKVSGSAVIQMV